MTRKLTGKATLLAVAALTAGLGLTGCSTISSLISGEPERDEETGQVTDESTVDVFSVEVGDCISSPVEEEQVQDLQVIPCDEPHDAEIYYEFEVTDDQFGTDGAYPGDSAIADAAQEGCTGAFEAFVGTPYDSSTLYISSLSPSSETWSDSTLQDRLISCTIFQIVDPNDASSAILQTTGTLAGSKL